MEKPVLDPCCGSRKFYYDKNNQLVLFGDIRDETYLQVDWRKLEVHPDQVMDVTALPFPDESFWHVVFDPPHLKNAGKTSFMYQAYGVLPKGDPLEFLRKGFAECWRVLKPHGTLVFKWNDNHLPLAAVMTAFEPVKPLYGNRKPGGKKGETFWMVFVKDGPSDN